MTKEELDELIEEMNLLVELHNIYIENTHLGGTEEERIEHILDIMERIAEIKEIIKKEFEKYEKD